MSKVTFNRDHRLAARLKAKLHLKQSQWRGFGPKLASVAMVWDGQRMSKPKKPPQPTIIKQGTAKSLAYLENHGLANFDKCNLVVAIRGFV